MTGNAIRIIKEDFLAFFKQCFFLGGRGCLGTWVKEVYIQEGMKEFVWGNVGLQIELAAYLASRQTATHSCH